MKKVVLWVTVTVLAVACKSFIGVRDFDRSNKDCDIKILHNLPIDGGYKIIGICQGRGGIFINDGSDKAYDRMMKCACQSGGNAIVLEEIRSGGYSYTDQVTKRDGFQTTSKIYSGKVIKLL